MKFFLQSRYDLVKIVVLIAAILLRLNNFSAPIYDAYYFRQTQTATVARNFAVKGINLLRPELDIFGIGKEQFLIIESPLYQTTVALLSNAFGYSEKLARLVSIAAGLIAAVSLYYIVKQTNKSKTLAILACIFFLFFPLNIFFQRTVMIESFVIMLHLLSIVLWIKLLDKPIISLFILALVVTTLATIGKIIYAPFLILFMWALAYFKFGKGMLGQLWLWIFFLAVGVGMFFWQTTANKLNVLSGHAFFTSENPEYWLWNVGYFSERLKLKAWILRINDILGGTTKLGALAAVFGLFTVFKKIKKYYLWLIWFGIMVVYYVFFFKIQSHIYYFLLILPSLAILAAIGVKEGYRLIAKQTNAKVAAIFIFGFMLSFLYKSGKNAQGYFVLHTDVAEKIRILNSELKESGPVVFIFPQWDWNSVYTYYTGRKGVVLDFKDLNQLSQFRAQGFKYAVFIDFKPEEIKQTLLNSYKLKETYCGQMIIVTQI